MDSVNIIIRTEDKDWTYVATAKSTTLICGSEGVLVKAEGRGPEVKDFCLISPEDTHVRDLSFFQTRMKLVLMNGEGNK